MQSFRSPHHMLTPPMAQGGLVLATLLASSAGATAAEQPCATPRAAVHTLFDWQGDERRSLARAAACLDLSQEPHPDAAPLRAKQIKDVLDARGLLVNEDDVPNDPEYRNADGLSRYPLFPSLPSFYIEQVGSRWLWSAATVAAVPEVHRRTFVVDIHAWVGRLPTWLQRSALGVAMWQLVGLLLLVVLAFVARALVMVMAASQARTVMIRLRARWGAEVLAHLDKPMGGLAGAAIVALLVPLLHLPVRLNQIGLLAARVWAAVSAVWALYRLVDLLAAWLGKKAQGTETKLDDQLVPLVQKALKVFIVAVGTIFVLQNLNIDVAGLVAGLGLGGLAFALAAKETIANLFGSATIFADRPFHIGDWVKVNDAEGIVESVGFRSSKIRTFYNSVVSIPNSMVASAVVDNLGARAYRRCRTVLGIRYDTTPEQVQAFVDGIRAIICHNPLTRKDYYEVHFNDFGASSLNIMVYFFFAVPSWSEELRQRHNVLLEILRLAKTLGVEFAFPTQTLQVESLAEPAAPAQRPVPSDDELAAAVRAFAPGGGSARPLGPRLTDGYFAS